MEANTALNLQTRGPIVAAVAPWSAVVPPHDPSRSGLTGCLIALSVPIALIQGAPLVAGRTYPISRRCKRFRSKAKHTKHHSPATANSPRSENWRKRSTSFTMPITGSTVHLRNR